VEETLKTAHGGRGAGCGQGDRPGAQPGSGLGGDGLQDPKKGPQIMRQRHTRRAPPGHRTEDGYGRCARLQLTQSSRAGTQHGLNKRFLCRTGLLWLVLKPAAVENRVCKDGRDRNEMAPRRQQSVCQLTSSRAGTESSRCS